MNLSAGDSVVVNVSATRLGDTTQDTAADIVLNVVVTTCAEIAVKCAVVPSVVDYLY